MTETLGMDLLAKAERIEARLRELKNETPAVPAAKPQGSRVIYVGHIPHGFYEDQMRGFFSQFGDVRNVRLSRSKRTGGSKGYGFVEFGDANVARIAAATMDKYLMAGRQLVCHVVDEDVAARPKLFVGKKRKVHRGSRTKLNSRIAKP